VRFGGRGYALLIGNGASGLASSEQVVQSEAGISLLGAQYTISAGNPPGTVGILVGGQNNARVTNDLTRQGWKRQGPRLVMLPLNLSNSLDGATAGWLSRVQPDGSDVVYGQQQADLSLAVAPSGQTLVQDPRIGGLADCLGDVVAADFFAPYPLSTPEPMAVAVGVSRAASDAAVPHAVVCVAWPSPAVAARYAAVLRKALTSGRSVASRQPWSAILHNSSVTSIGGSQNVVEWQAQTPRSALVVFQMIDEADLPALPDCARLPAQRAHIPGCP
jgi:hypothetical protein